MPDGGFVYFIQAKDGGPIKIGYSATAEGVLTRLRGMQVGNPSELVLRRMDAVSGPQDERRLHADLREWRIRGEWFMPTEDVLRRCDLIGHAKVGGGKVFSMHQVSAAHERAHREGAQDVVDVMSTVIEMVSSIVAEAEDTFDADTLLTALVNRLGHFLDTSDSEFGSTRGETA